MHRSTTRWATAAAAAALIALPAAAAAQTTGTTPPQPPAQAQTQPPTTAEQAAQPGQVDANAAKKHLSEARESLSQVTSMPEAAKLQGDTRTQVSQLISNFNDLITTQNDWRSAYAKVDANLRSLIGPEGSDPTATGTTGTAATATAGTTGTAGAAASLDPAIRAKLVEFRAHLKLFEKAAGGPAEPAPGAMAPSAATGSTANPANPATAASPTTPDPAKPGQPPTTAGATGTSGVSASPTATMDPAAQAKAAEQAGHSEADKVLDAITEILNKSKTGALTKVQTDELKKHVADLRALLNRK